MKFFSLSENLHHHHHHHHLHVCAYFLLYIARSQKQSIEPHNLGHLPKQDCSRKKGREGGRESGERRGGREREREGS